MNVGTARISVPGVHPSAETLEHLLSEHGNRVYQLAYCLTRSGADAEDILQEVFFKLHRNWVHVCACQNLPAWITRVVTNCAIDLLRSRKTRAESADPESLARLAGSADSPSRGLEERELEQKVRSALDTLPPHEMAALVLFGHQGIKSKEVGRILGVSEGTVRRYVFQARQKLKELLTPYLGGDHP
ncbi:MAG TPA: sigma-70 family RNA polymerase sigma factor [Planctomycetota bacterium]|nr:sigma-70 family RNA polymerase sigma factor [Planctomycetota bacterium]